MSSKRADDLPVGKPSPAVRYESRESESRLEGQQPKNADASPSISQGPASSSARAVRAATAPPPNTVPTALTSNRHGRHPLPTYDPSWSNPHQGRATKAHWGNNFHTQHEAWDGRSAPHDEGAFSRDPGIDFDVMRRRA